MSLSVGCWRALQFFIDYIAIFARCIRSILTRCLGWASAAAAADQTTKVPTPTVSRRAINQEATNRTSWPLRLFASDPRAVYRSATGANGEASVHDDDARFLFTSQRGSVWHCYIRRLLKGKCFFPPLGLEKQMNILEPNLAGIISMVRSTNSPNVFQIDWEMALPSGGDM